MEAMWSPRFRGGQGWGQAPLADGPEGDSRTAPYERNCTKFPPIASRVNVTEIDSLPHE